MNWNRFQFTPLTVTIGVFAGWVIARMLERRQLRELERIGAELGNYYGERDRQAAERERRMIDLTSSVSRLTWALLAVATVTLVVAIWALFDA